VNYPFFALSGLAGASGFALGGLPLPGTLRMASIVPTGYKASLVIGLIFCVWSLFSVAAMDIPNALAISVKVSPVIGFISAIIANLLNLRKCGYLLYKLIVVSRKKFIFSPNFRIFYIDIISEMADIYT
jgi:hypothetical protein